MDQALGLVFVAHTSPSHLNGSSGAAQVLTLWILAFDLFLTSDISFTSLPSHQGTQNTTVSIFSYFQWEDPSGELITTWKSKGFLHLLLPLTTQRERT